MEAKLRRRETGYGSTGNVQFIVTLSVTTRTGAQRKP
jgi:hypothetical protein